MNRVGNVLYWTFTGLAAIFAAVVALNVSNINVDLVVFAGVPAALFYLLGRACRYLFKGDAKLWGGIL